MTCPVPRPASSSELTTSPSTWVVMCSPVRAKVPASHCLPAVSGRPCGNGTIRGFGVGVDSRGGYPLIDEPGGLASNRFEGLEVIGNGTGISVTGSTSDPSVAVRDIVIAKSVIADNDLGVLVMHARNTAMFRAG